MCPRLLVVASLTLVLLGGRSQAEVARCHQGMTGLLYASNGLSIIHMTFTTKTPYGSITGHYHCKNIGKETDGCSLTGTSAAVRGSLNFGDLPIVRVELELSGKALGSPHCSTFEAFVIEQSLCIGGMQGSFSCGDGDAENDNNFVLVADRCSQCVALSR